MDHRRGGLRAGLVGVPQLAPGVWFPKVDQYLLTASPAEQSAVRPWAELLEADGFTPQTLSRCPCLNAAQLARHLQLHVNAAFSACCLLPAACCCLLLHQFARRLLSCIHIIHTIHVSVRGPGCPVRSKSRRSGTPECRSPRRLLEEERRGCTRCCSGPSSWSAAGRGRPERRSPRRSPPSRTHTPLETWHYLRLTPRENRRPCAMSRSNRIVVDIT